MSPSSPVSVEILPSSRTLEAGSLQIILPAIWTELEQCPAADDPFTDADSPSGEEMRDTGCKSKDQDNNNS